MNIQQIKSDFDNGVLLGRETLRALIDSALADSQRLDWLQDNHTLHKGVDVLYTVGEYEASLTYDSNTRQPTEDFSARGDTLREAIDNLREKTK